MRAAEDPFDAILRPPNDESPSERQARQEREAEAKRTSLAIDASIKAEKAARRKKRIVRLLLMGQSESGKSTTLRQFQRLYTPTAFRQERILWRAVIQLNVVRSVRTILDAITFTSSPPRIRTRSSSHPRPSASNSPLHAAIPAPPTYPPPVPLHRSSSVEFNDDDSWDPLAFPSPSSSFTLAHSSSSIPSPALEALRNKLNPPLQYIEAILVSNILQQEDSSTTHFSVSSPAAVDHPEHSSGPVSISLVDRQSSHLQQSSPTLSYITHPPRNNNPTPYHEELSVRFGPGWKGVLSSASLSSTNSTTTSGRSRSRSIISDKSPRDEPQEVLYSLRRDMIQLWNDPSVREILKKRKIRLEESSGFFLDDIERVTSLRFLPSDDDVLKARLKTVGVSEYKFEIELGAGRDTGTEWRIIDVGGSRSQRPTWVPYFDDADAIILLAPISAFDQVLSEDRTVNRLEDSVLLWKAVCSSKLLANVDLILFLNKCDILEKKLAGGVRMAKYVRNYGDRPNDLDSVCKYLRGKFSAIHREYSPTPRKFYAFCTSVTDTSTTSGIIASVRDMVIRQHLKASKLL